MLSRVAERLYWMARYHERTEDLCRLTDAYTHLLMDLPEGSEMGWDMLIRILDANASYESNYRVYGETGVLKFLLADSRNPSSIVSSVSAMRENARTTRDELPEQAWEYTNELHLYTQENAAKSTGRRKRYQFLDHVMMSCQQMHGFLGSTLSRDHAYRFINMGHLIERADMTTRVLDVGAAAILSREKPNPTFDPLLWGSLLRALSSISSYREYMGAVIEPASVADLVVRELAHPRSVIFCLRGIQRDLKEMPNNSRAMGVLDEAIKEVSGFSIRDKNLPKLHGLIEGIQNRLNAINDVIADSWFYHRDPN